MSATPSTKHIVFTLGEWSFEFDTDELSDGTIMQILAEAIERAGCHVDMFREHKAKVPR